MSTCKVAVDVILNWDLWRSVDWNTWSRICVFQCAFYFSRSFLSRRWTQSSRKQRLKPPLLIVSCRVPLKQANHWRKHAESPRLKALLKEHFSGSRLRKRSPLIENQHHFNLTLWRSSVWYAMVQLGTPAQTFKVICDTGSADFVSCFFGYRFNLDLLFSSCFWCLLVDSINVMLVFGVCWPAITFSRRPEWSNNCI